MKVSCAGTFHKKILMKWVRKMKANKEFLDQLEILLKQYESEVFKAQENGYIKVNTSNTYLLHANNFAKWCKGDFVPGGRNHNK